MKGYYFDGYFLLKRVIMATLFFARSMHYLFSRYVPLKMLLLFLNFLEVLFYGTRKSAKMGNGMIREIFRFQKSTSKTSPQQLSLKVQDMMSST